MLPLLVAINLNNNNSSNPLFICQNISCRCCQLTLPATDAVKKIKKFALISHHQRYCCCCYRKINILFALPLLTLLFLMLITSRPSQVGSSSSSGVLSSKEIFSTLKSKFPQQGSVKADRSCVSSQKHHTYLCIPDCTWLSVSNEIALL